MSSGALSVAAVRDATGRRWLPAVAVAASGICGAAVAVASPSVESFLVCAIAAACALPLLVRLGQHRLDVLEPIVVANIALAVMYVAQPAALLLARGSISFKGYGLDASIRPTLAIVLAATLAFQLGYALPWARHLATRLPHRGGEWVVETTTVFALVLAATGCAFFALFVEQSGGIAVLADLVHGRSSTQALIFQNSTAYLYSAPQLLWPASFLLVAAGLGCRRRALVVLGAIILVPLAIFAAGQGQRIVLLPLLLAPLTLAWLVRGWRPRPLVLALAVYLLLTVGIAYFRDTRTANARISRTDELRSAVVHPGRELHELVVNGTDNDMFLSLASERLVVPSRLATSPLNFAYRLAAKPVPSVLWHGKPLSPEEQLVHALYPSERIRASSSPGIVGSFYLAGALPGVVVGMVLLGGLLRLPWEYWRRAPSAATAQVMLIASLMFVPIALRGGLGDTLARILFGIVPLLVAARLCTRRAA